MRLLTVTEAAALCRVSDQTVRRWLAEGRIPFERHGHRYLVPEDAVARLNVSSIAKDDFETYVDRLVDAAPDLTLEQIDALKVLLSGPGAGRTS